MSNIKKSMFDANHLKSIASDIIQIAKQKGATECEVGVIANRGFSVSAHDGDVETVEYNQDKIVEIHVSFDNRSGSASISDVRPEAIQSAVEAACHIAKFTDQDEASGLASKEELAFDYPELQLSFPWSITVDEAIKLACLCERQALQIDKRIMRAEEVSVATAEVLHVLANSHGFVGLFPLSRHEISCVLVAKDKDEMQRNYSYSITADPADLKSTDDIAKEAVSRAVSHLGHRRIKTTKAPVLYVPEEARGLIGHFVSAISGGSIYRKSSFLAGKLDQAIFPDFFHIEEFPHLHKGLGSAPFDNDGVRTRNNVFIENGILKKYALGVYSARKLKMQTTGNAGGVHNLTVKTSEQDFKALLKTMGTGLVVTEMMGQGVNTLTGDYSRGASGFWVQNGEIQFPVQEVTIAGKLQDMFKNIVAVGNDVDLRGNIRTGSILIGEMMIAGS